MKNKTNKHVYIFFLIFWSYLFAQKKMRVYEVLILKVDWCLIFLKLLYYFFKTVLYIFPYIF